MATRSGLGYSPLSGKVYWGRQNRETGMWVGNDKRDVTNEFLQFMEHKFPVNTAQNVSVNGENKFRVIVVDMSREVRVDGEIVE